MPRCLCLFTWYMLHYHSLPPFCLMYITRLHTVLHACHDVYVYLLGTGCTTTVYHLSVSRQTSIPCNFVCLNSVVAITLIIYFRGRKRNYSIEELEVLFLCHKRNYSIEELSLMKMDFCRLFLQCLKEFLPGHITC